tara:strand:- start:199 stop:309 length:111 start_codon:yes stop_codon:yes gene_type:complete
MKKNTLSYAAKELKKLKERIAIVDYLKMKTMQLRKS